MKRQSIARKFARNYNESSIASPTRRRRRREARRSKRSTLVLRRRHDPARPPVHRMGADPDQRRLHADGGAIAAGATVGEHTAARGIVCARVLIYARPRHQNLERKTRLSGGSAYPASRGMSLSWQTELP